MIKKWFITGTNTNVGKTIISTILLKKASKLGFNTAGYKPISTGCTQTINGLRNQDAIFLKKNSNIKFKYEEINPFSFYNPLPPNFLNNKNNHITLKKLSIGLKIIQKKSNWIIIEGIGGWYTPIFKKITLADWVKKEKIPVILVIKMEIGCINHTILTTQAILNSGVQFSGWYANCIKPEPYILNYIYTINKFIKQPFLGMIPYCKDINDIYNNTININLPK
ncbi:dethiobiotin synthase [Buchnera aphidicola]|uniref:ATP-dependent dethiobiotin synthetase BioD n=1 Tax=Buchnera aphidicola (Therioaphis trifolii) TaxID=1241884 RepID=A0A4D6YPJ9_9GAMM|nr:dethiobiotin synthase [Buchnera aphidicola]QCI27195.1 dethiobiotin synthase [Buchnera aphidicola (Therioaphis trifolii)]